MVPKRRDCPCCRRSGFETHGLGGPVRWPKPSLRLTKQQYVLAEHHELGEYQFHAEQPAEFLFCENETNPNRIDPARPGIHLAATPVKGHFKDAFHQYVVQEDRRSVNPTRQGTKCAAFSELTIPSEQSRSLRFRLCQGPPAELDFDATIQKRRLEAGRVLRSHSERFDRRRCEECTASGVCRAHLDEAVLPLWTSNAGSKATPHCRNRPRRESSCAIRTDASFQRRHHFDARQVGVPLVRRMGSGVSLHSLGDDRRGILPSDSWY